jgi:hypothetical protein
MVHLVNHFVLRLGLCVSLRLRNVELKQIRPDPSSESNFLAVGSPNRKYNA